MSDMSDFVKAFAIGALIGLALGFSGLRLSLIHI